jgi:(2Fe-2S) ferredoxin
MGAAWIGRPPPLHPAGPREIRRVTEADPPLFYTLHLFVCTNRRQDDHPRGSCAARGSERLRDYMKARAKELKIPGIRVNTAGCLDRCEFGPALVIYPEGVWYRPTSIEDVEEILQVHVLGGGRVRRLMLTGSDAPPPKA